MAVKSPAKLAMKMPAANEKTRSLAIDPATFALRQESEAPAHKLNTAALTALPLARWLFDTIAPDRVLTVGSAAEIMHLDLCRRNQTAQTNAICVHISDAPSEVFTSARLEFGHTLSQVQYPDRSSPRFGAEGQFSLILLPLEQSFDEAALCEWKKGLSPDGVLLLYSRTDIERMTTSAPQAVWALGAEQLDLYWGPKTANDVISLGNYENTVDHTEATVLSNLIAAQLVELERARCAIAETALADMQTQLQETHLRDVLEFTRLLKEEREIVLAQNQQLKNLEQRLADAEGEVAALRTSTSWRLTTPIRFIRRTFS